MKLSSNKKTSFYSCECVPVQQKPSKVSPTGALLAAPGLRVADPLQKRSCSRFALQLLRAGPAELHLVFSQSLHWGGKGPGIMQAVASVAPCPLLPLMVRVP